MSNEWENDESTPERTTHKDRDENAWNRSNSEPDLSSNHPRNDGQKDRFAIKYHEYVTVDRLQHRRPRPQDFQIHSNISLRSDKKEENNLPFSVLKTEYRRSYTNPGLVFQSNIPKKSTSLKFEGFMEIESDEKLKYSPEEEEEEAKKCPSKPIKLSVAENMRSKSTIESEMLDTGKEPYEGEPAIRIDPPKCHLKLEGEINYLPEYRSQYVQFPLIEKSHSIPQLSNIKFQGSFVGMPSEYRESYKFYESYSKSAPIKKSDHPITFQGNGTILPEYAERFGNPEKNGTIQKAPLLKTKDHLKCNGEFSKNIPEYHESFRDPKITEPPERGKCREPYLRLNGKIEFNPEYRSKYLDYPRSRPIIRKSLPTFRLSNNNSAKKLIGNSKKKFYPEFKNTYHDKSLDDLPLTCQPEYRKAKMDLLIKERPLARKITEIDDKGTRIGLKTTKIQNGNTETDSIPRGKNQIRQKLNSRSPRRKSISDGVQTLPQFKLTTEKDQITNHVSPKFGRRASISRNAQNSRNRTTIIEGNAKYGNHFGTKAKVAERNKILQNSEIIEADPSFLVLDEPCKNSSRAWMKKSWYDT